MPLTTSTRRGRKSAPPAGHRVVRSNLRTSHRHDGLSSQIVRVPSPVTVIIMQRAGTGQICSYSQMHPHTHDIRGVRRHDRSCLRMTQARVGRPVGPGSRHIRRTPTGGARVLGPPHVEVECGLLDESRSCAAWPRLRRTASGFSAFLRQSEYARPPSARVLLVQYVLPHALPPAEIAAPSTDTRPNSGTDRARSDRLP